MPSKRTCTHCSRVHGALVMPQGHGEERPDTRSEKQCLSVMNIDWSLGEPASTYTPNQLQCRPDCNYSHYWMTQAVHDAWKLTTITHERLGTCFISKAEVDGESVSTASHKLLNRLQLLRGGLPGGVSFWRTPFSLRRGASFSSWLAKWTSKVYRTRLGLELLAIFCLCVV